MLSNREQQVLQLIADGLTDEQIAYTLDCGKDNASAYRKKLLEKMEVNNAAALVAKAFRRKLIK